jgi:hypothetical protein
VAESALLEIVKRQGWIGSSATPLASQWWDEPSQSYDYRPFLPLQQVNPALRIITESNLGRHLVSRFRPART